MICAIKPEPFVAPPSPKSGALLVLCLWGTVCGLAAIVLLGKK